MCASARRRVAHVLCVVNEQWWGGAARGRARGAVTSPVRAHSLDTRPRGRKRLNGDPPAPPAPSPIPSSRLHNAALKPWDTYLYICFPLYFCARSLSGDRRRRNGVVAFCIFKLSRCVRWFRPHFLAFECVGGARVLARRLESGLRVRVGDFLKFWRRARSAIWRLKVDEIRFDIYRFCLRLRILIGNISKQSFRINSVHAQRVSIF